MSNTQAAYNFQANMIGMGTPGYYVLGPYGMPVAHPTPFEEHQNQVGRSAPYVYIDLSQPEKAVMVSVSVGPSGSQDHKKSACTANLYLKVLNPLNKKKFVMYTLRHFPCDLETPDELREEIFCQCGEEVVSGQLNFIGYFRHSNKYWVNSEKDLADARSSCKKVGDLPSGVRE